MINPSDISGRADVSGSLAVSAQSLDKLRMQAKQSPDQALKLVAQQFETVFMNMMLKSMREATPQDGMFDSEQTKMFTGMLDQQLVQSMSSRGVGLADIMIKQLSRSASTDVTQTRVESVLATPVRTASAMPVPYSDSLANVIKNSPSQSTPLQQDFVRRMTPHAVQASQETGVPTHLVMGQAALESGWGRREIRLPDGSTSFNLFGIKASGNWNGKVAEVVTTEYHNGVANKQVEKFRAYSSYTEAFSDYAHLLRDNPRYAQVLQSGQGSSELAHALQRAGYATDPDYADKLVKVMNRINTIS
ncbi:flagellar assembly peptidoglycan hydrolase FlgJ [Candidatus Nitrotoga sp. AM1P]|uniref:flagellar assembly peptidoglycan hydrolase FlgJ n=1 Tax=Candidatus Nitrotoga sp. AM1P TaxID=2559597 RepID=UPI0010B07238|nr:flagellar assembly peptidoglycan hydrolase FlgJ [Candidatus Nitrotoga sp. AM1P]BBJ22473.1 flagellar rod assembly protein/muramidase FlgJ [Candidatus Nitrotoga sp. AM1P]